MRIRLSLVALCLLAGAARAESRHLEATGASLAIDSPCARKVTIQADPSLSGKYVLDATADRAEESARLVFDSGDTAKLHISTRSCDVGFLGNSEEPTLDLQLRVPPGVTLAVEESGGARYTIGAVGKLTLEVSGGVELQAASTADATVKISGGADIKIGQASGSMNVDVSGGGAIRVDRASLADLTLSMSGGGAYTLSQGTIGRLTLDVSGAGSVHIGAPVRDATISMSGAGDVKLASVTGKLTKEIDGVGSIDIGTP